jgi:GT2 family glycosyltransferase
MAIDDQQVAQRLEALQRRDAELGRQAEVIADRYRATHGAAGGPYVFPPIPAISHFYESFLYANPHHAHRQKKSSTTVLKQGHFYVFVPKHCVVSSTLTEVLQKVGDADFAYGDSFHYDPFDPSQFTHQLRPGWSPERLRGHCYVGDVVVASKKLVKRAGGRKFLASLSSHDRALRLSEVSEAAKHIDALLYGSPIESRNAPVDIDAVKSHCARTGINAEVELIANGQAVKVARRATKRPSICAIMPTRGTSADVFGQRVVLAAHAIAKLRERSTYSNIEIVVVADADTPKDSLEAITQLVDEQISVIPYDKPFNFAEKTNIAAVQTTADFLLFINDDTEIITPEIVEVMLSYFEDPTVGMVGPMLKYEDGTIQSAGHLLNPVPYDLYRGMKARGDAAFGLLNVAREVSSVIAAFSMTPRDLFEKAGGLSHLFPADYNDIDYALKLDMMGYRTIFTPHAECFHFESKTRVPGEQPESVALLGRRWQHKVDVDHYGNQCLAPHVSLWKSNHDSPWSRREAMGADTVTP